MSRFGRLLSISGMLMVLSTGSASAATRVVSQTATPCQRSALTYSTIQAAVDASNPDDTVLVCGGTYTGQVTIARNAKGDLLNGLRLKADTTYAARLRPPGVFTRTNALVHVAQARRVEVSRFTLQGPLPCDVNDNGDTPIEEPGGIRVDESGSASVRSNRFLDLHSYADDGCLEPEAIQFGDYASRSPGGGLADGNTILNNGEIGISVSVPNSRATVTNNVISGPSPSIFSIGIDVFRAAARITDNVVQNTEYGLEFADSAPGMVVENNHLTDNYVGLLLDSASARVTHNSVDDGTYGIKALGYHNLFASNHATGNAEYDCLDFSTGGGTAGTANIWTKDIGDPQSPGGICQPGS